MHSNGTTTLRRGGPGAAKGPPAVAGRKRFDMNTTIAALYVHHDTVYTDMGLDIWTEARDATRYPGPFPVVAHPPCSRWCQLAGLVEARYGYKVGDDGGCFAAALRAVRDHGGVLEHPAYTGAWPAHDLPAPPDRGWSRELFGPGWVCQVEQAHYGHPARKRTWLYAVGPKAPPPMRWGPSEGHTPVVSWTKGLRRIGKKEAAATPIEFAITLVELVQVMHSIGACNPAHI